LKFEEIFLKAKQLFLLMLFARFVFFETNLAKNICPSPISYAQAKFQKFQKKTYVQAQFHMPKPNFKNLKKKHMPKPNFICPSQISKNFKKKHAQAKFRLGGYIFVWGA